MSDALPCASWPRETLEQELGAIWPGLKVEIVGSIGSTNTELMARGRRGTAQQQPVLLVAEHQSAGRGRLGRVWHNAPSEADGSGARVPTLMFSLGLPLAPRNWSGLSLAVGVAVASSLHESLRLKWPNDIWLDDRKLVGILIETAGTGNERWAVIGVGVNIVPPPSAESLSTPPACLSELLPGIDAQTAMLRVAPALLRVVRDFEQQGFAPFQAAFLARDALRGREVLLSDGSTGTAAGVDEEGVLLVHTPAGMRKIASQEISVRPSGTRLPGQA